MKDLGWKLLSVAIAAIMWFMVINITQPTDTRSYSRPLTIENLSALENKGLTAGNLEELKNTKVTIKVKAQRTALDRLSQNPEWLTVTTDFSELSNVKNGDIVSLPVDVSIQGGNSYGISSKSPSSIDISIETLASKELPVDVVLSGTLEEGTYLSEPLLSAETILVTGPLSLVNSVTTVRATVISADIETSPDVTAELVCYNASGIPVKGVTPHPEEILISYALHDMKQVPLQVEITGTPAAGYQVDRVHCTPRHAALVGAAEELENLIYLQLDSINVSGLTGTLTQSFRLTDYLPEGLKLMEGSEEVVEVTVTVIEQSQKQLTVPASDLQILGQESDREYIFHGDAHITLTGDSAALNAVHADDLQASVHVNGLSAGEHRVMLHADMPDGIIMNPSYITVTVKDADASAEE